MVNKKSIKIFAWALVIILTYITLVIVDYGFRRYLTVTSMKHSQKAKAIAEERILEDNILRKKAVNEGYKPMLYPESIESYPILHNKAVEFDVAPLAPQPHSYLYFCNEGYGLIKYVSDRYGFRNTDKNWDKKIDILLIGDSFIHGACVDDDKTISGRLQEQFNVLNLGTAGNNPLHYAALAKNFVPITQPKILILTFFANDNGIGERDSIYYKKYFIENQRYLVEKNNKHLVPENLRNFYSTIQPILNSITGDDLSSNSYSGNSFYKILKYMSLPTLRHVIKMTYSTELHFSSKLAIDEAQKTCNIYGCKLFVLWIPSSKFWHPDGQANGYSEKLKNYCKKNNIPFIDSNNTLEKVSNNYALKGPHLSPEGYQAIANLINEKILER